MNIVVFGASGQTGHELLRQGIDQRHRLRAFVRNPAKLKIQNANIQVLQGDITDPEAIAEAVKGQDAAISALGASTILKRAPEQTNGVRNIIKALEQTGVARFIYLSARIVRAVQDRLNPFGKYVIVPILRNVAADHEENEANIERSHLDWTIVRPPRLTNGPRTGVYRSGERLESKVFVPQISRGDLADFMLKQITETRFRRKAVCVMY